MPNGNYRPAINCDSCLKQSDFVAFLHRSGLNSSRQKRPSVWNVADVLERPEQRLVGESLTLVVDLVGVEDVAELFDEMLHVVIGVARAGCETGHVAWAHELLGPISWVKS